MREIRTEIEISAPREEVWGALVDLSAYPEWNPFIKNGKGDLAVGSELKLLIKPPGAIGKTMKPKVVEVESGRRLSWIGCALLPGIFDGERYFVLEDGGDGVTHLIHGERFTGFLTPLMQAMRVLKSAHVGAVMMNLALKERLETPGFQPPLE